MANMHLVTGYAGTAHVTAADQGTLHTAIFGNGEFVFDKGNKLSASAISSNTVRVLDGDIMMQGRYIRLNEDNFVDLTIESGVQGVYRHDLIVARYTKDDYSGVEEVNLAVIKGSYAASDPADPAHTAGDIFEKHETLNEMLLYRVVLNGVNIEAVVPLFTVSDTREHTHTKEQIKNFPSSMPASDVYSWAKEKNKPTYSASEVGADPNGTAANAVSTHNAATNAHNDIRLLIKELTTRLNALANSDDTTLDQMAEVVAYIKANRDLIEQITTGKVSVTDIVNNLTTNVSNKPLSAAQGVALKALIDAIKVPTKASDIGLKTETWTFTLEDGSPVTKAVYVG